MYTTKKPRKYLNFTCKRALDGVCAKSNCQNKQLYFFFCSCHKNKRWEINFANN